MEDKIEVRDYSTELESGIFNLAVTLCSHKSNLMGIDKARIQVAQYLEHLADALKNQDTN